MEKWATSETLLILSPDSICGEISHTFRRFVTIFHMPPVTWIPTLIGSYTITDHALYFVVWATFTSCWIIRRAGTARWIMPWSPWGLTWFEINMIVAAGLMSGSKYVKDNERNPISDLLMPDCPFPTVPQIKLWSHATRWLQCHVKDTFAEENANLDNG